MPTWLKGSAKFIFAVPFTFHSFNGVRHLAWDVGYGELFVSSFVCFEFWRNGYEGKDRWFERDSGLGNMKKREIVMPLRPVRIWGIRFAECYRTHASSAHTHSIAHR